MDIKRLLKKGNFTGRELGIIELTDMAITYHEAQAGNRNAKPIMEREQLTALVRGLQDPIYRHDYNGYIAIHKWLIAVKAVADAQQAQVRLSTLVLMNFITNGYMAEDVAEYISKLPRIMTAKQYEEHRAAAIEASFKDENGEEITEDIFMLVESWTNYYLNLLQKEPKKPNPLKALKKKYQKELIQSKDLLAAYNEIMGIGYYILQDGRRSDQMTAEEWEAALDEIGAKRALYDNIDFCESVAILNGLDNKKRYVAAGLKLTNREPLYFTEQAAGLPFEWRIKEEAPDDITRWDIIETGLLDFYYPYNEDMEADLAEISSFLLDFKELADTALAEIDKNYFKGEKGLSGLSLEEWKTIEFDRRQLYNKGFYDYVETTEADTTIFDGDRRALFNGIAIIRNSDLFNGELSFNIDEAGYYKEPELDKDNRQELGLEALYPFSDHYAETADGVETTTATLLEAYTYIKGFNTAIDLIAAYFDVPALQYLKEDIDTLEQGIKALNSAKEMLFNKINATHYESKEEKKLKLDVLRDFFADIDLSKAEVPQAIIEKAQPLLKDYKAFSGAESEEFEALLLWRTIDTDEGDGE